jgi:hypothetical protein
MTDAAVSVTQSAVERFTEQYLRSLGCGIEVHEDKWEVTVPEGADTALSSGELTLVPADDPTEEESAEPLHPESALFQQIISEAGDRCPTGTLSIETKDAEVEIPAWLENSVVEVEETTFTPYYDRTAVVFLFQLSIETVSEYQREFLRAIAVDTRSEECLPKLEEEFLRLTSLDGNPTTSKQLGLEKSDIRALLAPAQSQLLERIQRLVDEVHEEASRAADAEVEEYRQMQQQRIKEVEEEHSNLSSKIDELNEAINEGDQEERVRALKQRKELKSDYDEIDAELSELRERRDQGFPEKQREIRERHALDVRTTPLTVTQVEYERGEIEIDLKEDETVQTVTAGYGSGVGLTEAVRCSSCNRELSDQNPLRSIKGGLRCGDCAPTASR